jgi:hypothetical protein
MVLAIDQLPDDVATLKRLLVERDAEVARRLTELEAQRAEMLTARLLIEKLQLQIARLRRIQFGRRSKQHDARVEQLEFKVPWSPIRHALRFSRHLSVRNSTCVCGNCAVNRLESGLAGIASD